MADNVAVTEGSGKTIAADDVGGVMHQRVKMSLGADGAATDAVGGAGTVSNAVQRMTLASDDPGVASLALIAASASVLDDWDESDRAKVNPIVGQAGIAAGAGAVGATVPRVTLASDDPGVASLALIAASASVLDDWDESDRAKVNPIAGQAGVAAGAGAVSALTQRVVIATDQSVIPAGGDVAHDGVDSGNPLKVGGIAKTSLPTAVADADRVNALHDKFGRQIMRSNLRELLGVQQTQISASTSETTIVTAVASTFLDLYGLILANTGATAVTVTIKDATAGTTRAKIYVPAGDTRGFMLPADAGIPQASSNNNWTATCSASTTAMEVTALYAKNT